jgi:hypothetical protein
MSQSAPAAQKAPSPQTTGFSQVQVRQIGHGDGAPAMSVLLSWHEKVSFSTGQGGGADDGRLWRLRDWVVF